MTKRLNTLERVLDVLAEHYADLLAGQPVDADEIHCPNCAAARRVRIRLLLLRGEHIAQIAQQPLKLLERLKAKEDIREELAVGLSPTLMTYQCVQCGTGFTAVVYRGPQGEDVAVFAEVAGGLATQHTPKAVAFYLDQAARSESVSARSACIAMYRSALEHLLEDQGFDARMCGPKLAQLDAALKAGTAPAWASRIDAEYMSMLKDLGNGVLHTNEGDISLQENATPEVVEAISISMGELLDEVYERPVREKEKKSLLASAVEKFKRKK